MDRDFEAKQIHLRLKEARQDRQLTQQDAAEHLGVARTVITAIEAGRRPVRAEELISLAEFYGLKVSDIVRTRPQAEDVRAQFRALNRQRRQDSGSFLEQPVQTLLQYADNYVRLERLCAVRPEQEEPPPYSVEHLPVERAGEAVASEERARLGLGEGPAPDLRELLEGQVGLRIFVMSLPSTASAFFIYSQQYGGCIALNAKQPSERNRWNCTHEFGHYLISRHMPDIVEETSEESRLERVIDSFAKHFLLPTNGVNHRFDRLLQRNAGEITPIDILWLASEFRVSFQAMSLRLEELGRLRTGTGEQLNDRGFRVRETQERYNVSGPTDDFATFSRRYRGLLLKALADAKISEGEAAKYLITDRLGLRRIVAETLEQLGVEDLEDVNLNLTGRIR